jgi:hypothetical protein
MNTKISGNSALQRKFMMSMLVSFNADKYETRTKSKKNSLLELLGINNGNGH